MKAWAVLAAVVFLFLLVLQFVFNKPVFEELFGIVEKFFNTISEVISNAS